MLSERDKHDSRVRQRRESRAPQASLATACGAARRFEHARTDTMSHVAAAAVPSATRACAPAPETRLRRRRADRLFVPSRALEARRPGEPRVRSFPSRARRRGSAPPRGTRARGTRRARLPRPRRTPSRGSRAWRGRTWRAPSRPSRRRTSSRSWRGSAPTPPAPRPCSWSGSRGATS